jgi:DNA processing protein
LREYESRFPGKICREGSTQTPPERPEAPPPLPKAKESLPFYSLKRDEQGLTDDQIALLRILPTEEGAIIDDLVEESGIPIRRVLSALTTLEVGELVSQQSGKRYVRTVTLTE